MTQYVHFSKIMSTTTVLKNFSKCTLGGVVVSTLHHLWALWLSELPYDLFMCHRRVSPTTSLEMGIPRQCRTTLVGKMVPLCMCERLDYALAIHNGFYK